MKEAAHKFGFGVFFGYCGYQIIQLIQVYAQRGAI